MLARSFIAFLALFSAGSQAATIFYNGTALEDRSLEKRYICETSDASPSTADARAAALHIAGLAKQCCVLNPGGSHCNTMYKTGSAAGMPHLSLRVSRFKLTLRLVGV